MQALRKDDANQPVKMGSSRIIKISRRRGFGHMSEVVIHNHRPMRIENKQETTNNDND
jgi:hypothetical protein